jgi:hypothetical protein
LFIAIPILITELWIGRAGGHRAACTRAAGRWWVTWPCSSVT